MTPAELERARWGWGTCLGCGASRMVRPHDTLCDPCGIGSDLATRPVTAPIRNPNHPIRGGGSDDPSAWAQTELFAAEVEVEGESLLGSLWPEPAPVRRPRGGLSGLRRLVAQILRAFGEWLDPDGAR